jgi:hypothetical protein
MGAAVGCARLRVATEPFPHVSPTDDFRTMAGLDAPDGDEPTP